MNPSYFGKGVYGQIPEDSLRENPEILRGYQNELALSRGQKPRGLKKPQKTRPGVYAKLPKSAKSQLKRNLLIAGACLSLPFAAGFVLAENGSGLDENYLPLQFLDTPTYHVNDLLEMAAIIGVTSEIVRDGTSLQVSNIDAPAGTWLETMPKSDYRHPENYNKPIVYKIGQEAILRLESNRDAMQSTRLNLTIENTGSNDLAITEVSISADKCFSNIQTRSDRYKGPLSPGEIHWYAWDIYPSTGPSCNKTAYVMPKVTYESEFSDEISRQRSSIEQGPLRMHIRSDEGTTRKGESPRYLLEIQTKNEGDGILTIEELKLSGSSACQTVLGSYLGGESKKCSFIVDKNEVVPITLRYSYQISIGRPLKITN